MREEGVCRGGEFDLVLDELKDTIASGDSVEAECERKEFAAAVSLILYWTS